MRTYSLFARERGTKRWTRISLLDYSKQGIISRSQDILIASFGSRFELQIRPTNNKPFNKIYFESVIAEIKKG
jgi:hypothetical protein